RASGERSPALARRRVGRPGALAPAPLGGGPGRAGAGARSPHAALRPPRVAARDRGDALPLRARRRRAGLALRRARGRPARGAVGGARSRARQLRPRRRGLGPRAALEGPRRRRSLRLRPAHTVAHQVNRSTSPRRPVVAVLAKALMTAIYPVPDVTAAKAWYSEAFGVEPYFEEPFYVGFEVAGYELGLVPAEAPVHQ